MSDGPGRPPFRFADIAIPLVMLGTGAAATAVAAVGWLAGVLAADTHTVVPTPVWPILRAITQAAAAGSLEPLIGPAGSRPIFWTTTTILALLILAGGGVLVWWATRRLDRFGNVARSLGRARDYRDMRGTGARRRAVSLRPSLAAQPAVARDDIGLRLGRLGRHDLFAAEEDVLLHIAGPRSNKTSALVVPAVLSAPGPLIATSNKVDLHILTCGLRAQVGRVFIFDPQHIAGVAQTWWWNPLASIRDVSDAHHLVAHFSHTVGAGHERADPYFTKGAERLLAQLCLAAAVSGHHLRHVQHWLATRSDTPVQLLRDADHAPGRHRAAGHPRGAAGSARRAV